MVNKVSAKYKTKNIKTDCKAIFLATINQMNAKMISSRNLKLMATSVKITRASGSLVCPFRKTINVIMEITENDDDKTGIS
jgi:hypothetical protein